MVRSVLRKLRGSQPFNYVATTVVKSLCGLRGATPESVVRRLPRVGTVHTRLPDGRTLRLWSFGDDFVANEVFWKGWDGYEPETTPVFYRLAREAGVVLDVGAHVGYYSLLAAMANPAGRVLAFEPLPKAVERFRLNVRANGLSNVELVECAVGDSTGTATFFHMPTDAAGVPSSSGLSARFFGLPFFVESGVTSKTEVNVCTLDEVLAERGVGRVGLIKVDTETTEQAVFEGALATLERDHPDLIFEVLPGQGTAPALSRLLEPLGYTFYLLRDTGPERRDSIEDHAEWWNYLARHEGR